MLLWVRGMGVKSSRDCAPALNMPPAAYGRELLLRVLCCPGVEALKAHLRGLSHHGTLETLARGGPRGCPGWHRLWS